MKLKCPNCGAQVGEVTDKGEVKVCHQGRCVIFGGMGQTDCPRCGKRVQVAVPKGGNKDER